MNKLDELTVWALYILAFNEEQRNYVRIFHRVVLNKISIFNTHIFEDRVKLASIKAIELYKPQWS